VLAFVATLISAGVGSGTHVRGAAEPSTSDPRSKPNFVVVMTDDQAIRSLHLMPSVQQDLADRGMTFPRSFVTTPECCPSRATFLTGQYSHNHGVPSADPPEGGYEALTRKANILPRWLQDAGYRTGHVGKYLNGYGISRRGNSPTEVPPGWDYWRAPVKNTAYQAYGFELNQDGRLRRYGHDETDYLTDVLADKADRFLRQAPDGEPFFLSVAPVAPHSEGVLDDNPSAARNPRPAPRHLGDFDDLAFPLPPSFGVPVADAPFAIRRKMERRAEILSIEDLEAFFLGRSESLLAVDDLVGRLVDRLRAEGELDNTYFIYTSDNGFLLGEHRLTGKVVPYEEAIRVPLVIRGPGIKPGSRERTLVANIDLAPTISALADAQPRRAQDGHSLVPLFRGQDLPGRDLAFEYLTGREAFSAIRTERWKFITYATGGSELYDLRHDPHELLNLASFSRYEEVRRRLTERRRQLSDCKGKPCRRRPL